LTTQPTTPDRAAIPRNQADPDYQWDLSVIYRSQAAWEAEKTQLLEEIPTLDRFKGKLASPETLKEALDALMSVHKRLERLSHYASRFRDEDLALSGPAAMVDSITKLGSEIRAATAYFDPEVLNIDDTKLKAWMATASFAEYDRYLHDLLRQKNHVLSPAEEKVLANASAFSPVLYHTYSTFSDAELKRPSIELSNGSSVEMSPASYRIHRQSPIREDRKKAFEALWGLYGDYKNTFAHLLSGQVTYNNFLARTRNYDSVLHLALHRNEIPVDFYHTLIDRVTGHLDSFHRYLELPSIFLRSSRYR